MVLIESLNFLEDEYRDLLHRQHSIVSATGCVPSPVLICCSMEVDSLAAAKMLTGLLRADDVAYSVKAVDSYPQLVSHVKDTLAKDENVISIFLINCGGTYRIVTDFGPLESRVKIYLLDAHRPYALSNVHSPQVRILHDCLDKLTYPAEDELEELADEEAAGEDELDDDGDIEDVGPHVLDDDEDEEDDEEDEQGEFDETIHSDDEVELDEDGHPIGRKSTKRARVGESKKAERKRAKDERRRQLDAARLQRQEARRSERRSRLMQLETEVRRYYSGGTWFGCTSAVLMYEMCNLLRKKGNHDLWLAILGLTDQFVHERIAPGSYSAFQVHMAGEAGELGNETEEQMASMLRARATQLNQKALSAVVTRVGHIGDLLDYRLPLLRWGSLYHSLKHASYVLARLETWTEAGKAKLRTLLTELGIATSDARQLFRVLPQEAKQRLDTKLEGKASDPRYNLPDIRFKSFVRQLSPSMSIVAQDAVLALSALLELPLHSNGAGGANISASGAQAEWTKEQGFWRAWTALDAGGVAGAGGSNSAAAMAAAASTASSAAAAAAAGSSRASSSASKLTGSNAASPNALLLLGIDQSMNLQKLVLSSISWCQSSRAVLSAGSAGFRYAILPDAADSTPYIAHPLALRRLAIALAEYMNIDRRVVLPLVLASPLPGGKGEHLVVATLGATLTPGVSNKNHFGARFALAAVPELRELEMEEEADEALRGEDEEARRERLVEEGATELARLRVQPEAFDPSVVTVKSEDLQVFLDRLSDQTWEPKEQRWVQADIVY